LNNQHTDTLYTTVVGGLVSAFVYLVGGVDKLFIAFAIFLGLDYATGILAAIYKDEVRSRKGMWGLVRKGVMIVLVIVAHQLDIVAGNEAHFMRNAMIMFLIGIEGISVLENLDRLGVKTPKFINSYLKKIAADDEGKAAPKRRKTDAKGKGERSE